MHVEDYNNNAENNHFDEQSVMSRILYMALTIK